jgi:hypothetical protein
VSDVERSCYERARHTTAAHIDRVSSCFIYFIAYAPTYPNDDLRFSKRIACLGEQGSARLPCVHRTQVLFVFGLTLIFQFANDASGGNMQVGRSLHSCTSEVSKSPMFQIDGRSVVLIDTPGFDDEEVSDVGTLKQIAAYLSTT